MRQPRGRHHAGGPVPRPYEPVVFDVWERETAADLTARSPRWFVVWGTYWRCWSAYARFSARPLVVHESNAAALRERMREVERAGRAGGWW